MTQQERPKLIRRNKVKKKKFNNNPNGRPRDATHKLTDERINNIVWGLSNNLGKYATCRMANVDPVTYNTWYKRGKEDKTKQTKYYKFYDAVEKAIIQKEILNFENIRKAAEGGKEIIETKTVVRNNGEFTEETTIRKRMTPQWQASAWILERVFPEKYRRDRETETDSNETVNKIKQALTEIDDKMSKENDSDEQMD